MKHRVFISYARSTCRADAAALREALGEDAFLDQEDLELMQRFPPKIVEALMDSSIVVVFADKAYFQRWYCRWELRAALTPHLALGPGATETQENAALAHLIIALPEDANLDELAELPPAVRQTHWPRSRDVSRLAAIIRERLYSSPMTLGERIEAAGGSRAETGLRLLSVNALPALTSLAGTRVYPLALPDSVRESFVGRARELWRIDHALSLRGVDASCVALSGGAGVGKSQLAAEYVHRLGPLRFPGGIFWVEADVSDELLVEQFHGILKTLRRETPALSWFRWQARDVSEELARVLHEETAKARILFVVNNLPETSHGVSPRPLRTWCPALGRVAVLVTSRLRLVGEESIIALSVDALPSDAAAGLLSEGLNRRALPEDSWQEIAAWVGCLPLALVMLNRAMRLGGASPMRILAKAQGRTGALLTLREQGQILRRHTPSTQFRGVEEAFSLSYRMLSRPARRAARRLAWLAPTAIPDVLIDVLGAELLLPEVRVELTSRSFVNTVSGGPVPMFGTMHRLLLEFLQAQSKDAEDEWAQTCESLVGLIAAFGAMGPLAWPKINASLPHVEAVLANTPRLMQQPRWKLLVQRRLGRRLGAMRPELLLNNMAGAFLYGLGELHRAKRFAKAALDRTGEIVSAGEILEMNDYTIISTYNTGNSSLELTESLAAIAVERAELVLAKVRRRNGKVSRFTLAAMEALASALAIKGSLIDAQVLYEEVLASRQGLQGVEHQATLKTTEQLASILKKQGDIYRARELAEHVLAVRQRVQGDEHPDTLKTLDELGTTLALQGDLPAAYALYERLFAVRRRLQGEDHPATLDAMENLAATMREQGHLWSARTLYEQALGKRRRTQGPQHLNTVRAETNLNITTQQINGRGWNDPD